MDIVKVFGTNLKKYRTAMGISQEAFADKCGIKDIILSAIDNGDFNTIYDLQYQKKTIPKNRLFSFIHP